MKSATPARPVEVAVVGIGIHGLGMDGAAAFIERLLKTPAIGEAEGPDRDLGFLALAAADEAHASVGAWNPSRSSIFLSLEKNPGGGLELLPRAMEQRFGMQGKGGICLGDELGGNLALEAALRRIETGVLDGALVGAVQGWPGAAGREPGLDWRLAEPIRPRPTSAKAWSSHHRR